MKCIIPGLGIKAFGKAIFCLSRIGEELYIEALDDGLALKTVNTARSAFACFLFERKFFHSYRDSSSGRGTQSQRVGEEENSFKGKISTKSILSVFRALHTLERTVDRCTLNLDPKESKLVFIFHCKHGVVKTHNLGYQECEALQAVFTKELCPNHISAPAKVLSEAVTHLPTNLEEMTLTAHPTSVKLRNFVEDTGDGGRPSLTEISLAPEEFDHYQVGMESSITFCLKELRAILMFTDAINHSLSLRFEEPGRPVVLSIEDGKTYKADFVLATLLDGNSSHQSRSAMSQNQSDGFDTHRTTVSHDMDNSATIDNTLADTRPPATAKTASKSHRPLPSVNNSVEFPSSSQFNPPADAPTATPPITDTRVPSPPDDLDFMDMEIEYAGHTDTGSRQQTTRSSVGKGSLRDLRSEDGSPGSKNNTKGRYHERRAGDDGGGAMLTTGDDFDVMDAIFGVENLNDVAEEGNEFGFGVERRGSVGQSLQREKEVSPKRSVTQTRGSGSLPEEDVDERTQDSVINDSGFLPRSPQAKKHKSLPYSALFGMAMFSDDHNQSEVLAPDSDSDSEEQ